MGLHTALFVSKRLQLVLAAMLCLMAARVAAEALKPQTPASSIAPATASHAVLSVRQPIEISRSGR
jgi:hypothetical protein